MIRKWTHLRKAPRVSHHSHLWHIGSVWTKCRSRIIHWHGSSLTGHSHLSAIHRLKSIVIVLVTSPVITISAVASVPRVTLTSVTLTVWVTPWVTLTLVKPPPPTYHLWSINLVVSTTSRIIAPACTFAIGWFFLEKTLKLGRLGCCMCQFYFFSLCLHAVLCLVARISDSYGQVLYIVPFPRGQFLYVDRGGGGLEPLIKFLVVSIPTCCY